jgi:hypothetical protein
MNYHRALRLAFVLLGTPGLAAGDEMPGLLTPYVRLARQCAQYHLEIATASGALVEEFATPTNQTWKALPTSYGRPTIELRQLEGRDILAITTLTNSPALVAVGHPLIGDARFEMLAYSDSGSPCDLSIFLGPIAQSPGFQFGGYRNTRNILWAETGETNAWQAVDLPAKVLITPRRWHTVRLEIAGRELIGSVDGHEIGRTKLSDQYDLTQPRQPAIYCFDSTILVDRFTISRSDAALKRKDHAWQKVFGALTPAEVNNQIGELIRLLDHENSQVRDGAQALLAQTGPLAAPALHRVSRSGSLEQRLRAREILGIEPARE